MFQNNSDEETLTCFGGDRSRRRWWRSCSCRSCKINNSYNNHLDV